MIDLAERAQQIKKQRGITAAWATLITVSTVEILFASFAFGASFGPGPLKPIELVFGLLFSFGLGATLSFSIARRRVEKDARLIVVVHEGRRERRVAVFEGYFTIDSEVIVSQAITSLSLEPRGLVLRYRDPAYEGAVLRELSGERAALERLAGFLTLDGASEPARAVPRG